MSDVPLHFAYPFAFDANGNVRTVEQDTPEEVAACVANICVCPAGFRVDEPTFGIPDPMFRTLPLDVTSIVTAVERWESRAEVLASGGTDLDTVVANTVLGRTEADYGGTEVALTVNVPDQGNG